MIGNNGVPQHQIGHFVCPECGEGVFETVNAVKFVYDKLDPMKMQPVPTPGFRCLGCHGFLMKDKEKGFIVVHREKPPIEGDEWKGGFNADL